MALFQGGSSDKAGSGQHPPEKVPKLIPDQSQTAAKETVVTASVASLEGNLDDSQPDVAADET